MGTGLIPKNIVDECYYDLLIFENNVCVGNYRILNEDYVFDGNIGNLPFSFTVMTDEEGYNGGCLAYGPGKGLSTSSQKSITISPNSVIDLLNKIGE